MGEFVSAFGEMMIVRHNADRIVVLPRYGGAMTPAKGTSEPLGCVAARVCESFAGMKVKTIQFTTKVSCPAGHAWAPRSVPEISGSLRDSTVLTEHFTAPIRTTFDLHDFDQCPACDGAASAITFEAVPGEMDVPDEPNT